MPIKSYTHLLSVSIYSKYENYQIMYMYDVKKLLMIKSVNMCLVFLHLVELCV